MGKRYRVVHAGTGAAGIYGLRTIIKHRDLALVGQFAKTPAKIGMDSGDIVGLGKIGIIATNDWDGLLALKPDCVCYMADSVGREADTIAEVGRCLERGINVVTSSLYALTYPPTAPAPTKAIFLPIPSLPYRS